MPWYRVRVVHVVKGVERVTDRYEWEERHLSTETREVRARVAARPFKGTGSLTPVVLEEIPRTFGSTWPPRRAPRSRRPELS